MMHRHLPTPPGTFAACQCGHEPRHIHVLGRSTLETGSVAAADRHMLECRCGRTTAKYATLQAAENEWGPLLSQIPLVLPAAVTRLPRRAAPRKEVRHG